MAVDCTPSPTLKLDCPLVEHSKPTAEPVTEPTTKPIAELVTEPAVLSNNYSRMRLCLHDDFFFHKGFLYLSAFSS